MLLKSRSIGSPAFLVNHGFCATCTIEVRLAGSFSSIQESSWLISMFSTKSRLTGSLERSYVFRSITPLALIGNLRVMRRYRVTPAAQMSAFLWASIDAKCYLPLRYSSINSGEMKQIPWFLSFIILLFSSFSELHWKNWERPKSQTINLPVVRSSIRLDGFTPLWATFLTSWQ